MEKITESLKLVGHPYPLLQDKVEKTTIKVIKYGIKEVLMYFFMGLCNLQVHFYNDMPKLIFYSDIPFNRICYFCRR